MAASVIGYFFYMMSTFGIILAVLIGVAESSSFETPKLRPIGRRVVEPRMDSMASGALGMRSPLAAENRWSKEKDYRKLRERFE